MERVQVRIDGNRTERLLRGETVAVKIPDGAQILEFRLNGEVLNALSNARGNPLAKIMDVFFNGRRA